MSSQTRNFSGINYIGSKVGSSGPATSSEISQAVQSAKRGTSALKSAGREKIITLLETMGKHIQKNRDPIIKAVCSEAHYPEGRVEVEFNRTIGQFNTFAATLRDHRHFIPRLNNVQPSQPPRPDLRKTQVALGPVAVFGASNFPLAYSVPGGDTASAIAAGCGVVVKAHPAHPKTSDVCALALREAIQEVGLPLDIFSMVCGGNGVGEALVKHEGIQAVGFTGSVGGGRFLYNLAASRETPIPVFAEMGAVNPVVFMPDAVEKRASLASDYGTSMTMSSGQFCTNPGISLLVHDDASVRSKFLNDVASHLKGVTPSRMLTDDIAKSFGKHMQTFAEVPGVKVVYQNSETAPQGPPTLLSVDAETFVAHNQILQAEAFGPSSLVVECASPDMALSVLATLHGQLTGTVHFESINETTQPILDALAERAGRVIVNGFPTGVDVSSAQNHTGPYPASSCPQSTAVGPDAIARWMRPVAYQNTPESLLPDELKSSNPLGIWRLVDDSLTRSPVSSGQSKL